ncbi:Pentatricopeptide repeat-containing protein -chloroplastic [Striga hermonthica]|uniref:Pentatricopeptide repeat-containing protein -chloroplastic n=1 Tax=Striga hermonthica TaxID=68872 RepID=A0A9N7RI44_STRHE|nr:Pentatricopeptide repeat-containing protein -chloroplastic [Striga hermonthica]
MSNTKAALMALEYFLRKVESPRKVVLYNVTMKVCRKSKDLEGAVKLFDEMLERGIKPDNTTFSTLIGCARLCSLPEKAIEWYEKMPAFGLEPDGVTCSVMIDSYGRVGKEDVAFALYDQARNKKWRLDAVTFSTLIKIYTSRGNFDGCLNLYEEMKTLGVKPNASVYNSLLEAMGRAKRPWQAKNIYRDMIKNKVNPTWATYAALLRAYSRGRYCHDILAVYKEMKEKNFELNVVLYNTILSACADVGFTDEAFAIFEDMKNSGTCNPDSWTYSSLITIYSCSGQVEEAEATLSEMMASGFEPNIIVLTSIIQCYGKAGRTGDVVKTFDMLSDFGITPDEQFLCCLLSVLTEVPKEELGQLTVCIEKANPKLGHFVNLVINGESLIGEEASELFDSVSAGMRKAYLNCLIDLSVHVGQLERPTQMLKFGLEQGIYDVITIRSDKMWYLRLRRLSQGAALTGLRMWMNDLLRAVDNGEELPNLLGIDTGHGKHKFSDRALMGLFEAHLKELDAPFHEVPDKPGWFQTTNVAAKAWLESRRDLDDDPNGA